MKRYIPVATLRQITLLSLKPDQIEKLAGRWNRSEQLALSWTDIEILARRFLAAESDDGNATDEWHHLLMTVGNFKRRSGLISPGHLTQEAQDDLVHRPDRITIQGTRGQAMVECSNPASWRNLTEKIPGLSVPTATTLLSALWPDYHVIIDWNDRDAAVGLDAAPLLRAQGLDRGWFNGGRPSEREPYWELYDWFRQVVADTASSLTEAAIRIRPRDVERALFVLGRETLTFRRGPDWTWSGYHELLKNMLDDLRP